MRFGFVRFRNIRDQRLLEKKLDAIWIETYKLKVNLSMFNRGRAKAFDNLNKRATSHGQNNFVRNGVSYAKIVSGVALNEHK